MLTCKQEVHHISLGALCFSWVPLSPSHFFFHHFCSKKSSWKHPQSITFVNWTGSGRGDCWEGGGVCRLLDSLSNPRCGEKFCQTHRHVHACRWDEWNILRILLQFAQTLSEWTSQTFLSVKSWPGQFHTVSLIYHKFLSMRGCFISEGLIIKLLFRNDILWSQYLDLNGPRHHTLGFFDATLSFFS